MQLFPETVLVCSVLHVLYYIRISDWRGKARDKEPIHTATMSLSSSGSDRSSDSSNNSSSSPTERKNADFSISAILSDDTGSSSSRKMKVTPVRGQERRTSTGMLVSPPGVLDMFDKVIGIYS